MNLATHAPMKLGKKPAKHDSRTLMAARYFKALAPAPAEVKPPQMYRLGVMLNDQLGDCTCAAMGHMVQAWTAANGSEIVLDDAAILKAYEEACGYNPADPSTDEGGVEVEVLAYWRRTGVGGHKIAAFVALEPKSREHLKQACFLFGGCYLGVQLPVSAQNQIVWDVAISGAQGDPTPESWGGHAVPIVGYNETGPICITWGQLKQMTWAWFDVYCEEAYAVLSMDWATNGKSSPSGFDLAALSADLAAVTG